MNNAAALNHGRCFIPTENTDLLTFASLVFPVSIYLLFPNDSAQYHSHVLELVKVHDEL